MNVSNVKNTSASDIQKNIMQSMKGNNNITDFAGYLGNISTSANSSANNNINKITQTLTNGNKDNTKDIIKSTSDVTSNESINNTNNPIADKIKKADSKDRIPTDIVEDTDDVKDIAKDISEDTKLMSKLAEIIQNLLTTINQTIADDMEVSAEDITMVFEKLDISIEDLFNPEKVKEILTELTGTDEIALITDENMTNLFGNVMDNIKDILTQGAEELGISDEELKRLLAELDIKATDVTDNTLEKVQTALEDIKNNAAKEITDIPVHIINDKADDEELGIEKNDDYRLDNNSQTEEIENTDKNVIKTAKDNESSSDAGKDNQRHGHNDDIKGDFVSNLSDHLNNVMTQDMLTGTKSTYQSTQTSLDIINQILESAKVKELSNGGSIELTLTPETLGKVNLTVAAKNGVITANITAQTEAAKDAIAANIEVLKENLNNQGIKVESVEVAVASHNLEQNLEQNERGHEADESKKDKTSKIIFDENGERITGEGDGVELSTEEIRRRNPLELDNTKVNYFV